jgi:hypothetical protein
MARQVITAIQDRLNFITQVSFRVEHDLDDGRIFQPAGDRRSHRPAKHADVARSRFGFEGNRPHYRSPVLVTAWRDRMPGIIKKAQDLRNATTEMEE